MGQNKYSKSQSVTVKRITEDFKNLERRKIIFDKIKLLISPEIQRALMSNQGNNQGGYPPPPGGVGPGGGPPMPEQSQPVDLATSRASNQPLRIPTVPRPNLAPPRSTGGVAILGESPYKFVKASH